MPAKSQQSCGYTAAEAVNNHSKAVVVITTGDHVMAGFPVGSNRSVGNCTCKGFKYQPTQWKARWSSALVNLPCLGRHIGTVLVGLCAYNGTLGHLHTENTLGGCRQLPLVCSEHRGVGIGVLNYLIVYSSLAKPHHLHFQMFEHD